MNTRFLLLLLLLLPLLGAVVVLRAQTPSVCYGISFGLEVRPEAQAILDEQGYLVANIENEMSRSLNSQYDLIGECFTGELGIIVSTEPRIFAVFQSTLSGYGVLRIMLESQYYPEPFPVNSVGWVNRQELREP